MFIIPTAKKLVIGAVAVGALSFGTAGMAGAATVPGTQAISHFNCANATKMLTRIDKGEARIAAGLPKLTAAQAQASKAGDTKLANRLAKRITRLESSKFHTRLTKASAAIEAKCNVTAPSTATTSNAAATA
jgi:uncharacterized protein HemY